MTSETHDHGDPGDAEVVGQAQVAGAIRARRAAVGWSLIQLAKETNYSQTHVANCEKPGRTLASAAAVERIDQALGADGELIRLRARAAADGEARQRTGGPDRRTPASDEHTPAGIGPGRAGARWSRGTVTEMVVPRRTGADDVASTVEVEDMERRSFLAYAAAVTVGAIVFDLERWSRMGASEQLLPSRLVDGDVAVVESMTAAMRGMDFRHGGGGVHGLAEAHLERARRLLGVECADPVRRRLWIAVADLHNVIGRTALDIGRPDLSRAHHAQALELAQAAHEPSLVATTLLHVGTAQLPRCAGDALRMIQLGAIPAKDSGSELLLATLSANESWAYGCLGDAVRAGQAMLRARDGFARAQATDLPGWMTFFTGADLDSCDGAAHIELARTNPAYAGHGIELLHSCLAERGADRARAQASETISLATGYLYTGEIEHGLTHARQAITLAETLQSTRLNDRLAPLAHAASTRNSTDLTELRAAIDRLRV